MRQILATVGAAVLFGAAPAAAQDTCSEYVKTPAVGGWSSYRLTDAGEPGGTLKFALVGTENRGEEEMYWLEMTVESEARESMIMKMLIPDYPYEPAGVEEIIMQMGDQPPMRMSESMLAMTKGAAAKGHGVSAARQCEQMAFVGREEVTVPAGSFTAAHYRDENRRIDIWVSKELPFGMVKTADGKGSIMELTGHGSGAKSAITGTPQEMDF